MRITHSVWIRGKDPVDIALISKSGDEGNTQYVIAEQRTGVVRRVLSQEETDHLQTFLQELTLPVVPRPTQHGGNTYMLQLETGFNSVAYYWASKPPSGWEKLKELSELLVSAYTADMPCERKDIKDIEVRVTPEIVTKGGDL